MLDPHRRRGRVGRRGYVCDGCGDESDEDLFSVIGSPNLEELGGLGGGASLAVVLPGKEALEVKSGGA